MASTSSPPPQPYLRNPFSPEIEPPLRQKLETISRKRRCREESRNKSLMYGLELQSHVDTFLQPNDLSSLQETINDPLFKTVFKSLAYHYPNAFAFKLVKLLQFHPPTPIRIQTVSILRNIFKESDKIIPTMLIPLKELLFLSLTKESDASVLPILCETIGLVASRLYQYPDIGGWYELHQYISASFTEHKSKLNHHKGLLLLAELPVESVENREFWIDQGHFDFLFNNLITAINSSDNELQELTFNASWTVMRMSRDLERTDVCDSLLPLLLCLIDLHHGEEDELLDMLKRLENLVTMDIEEIFNGKEGDVFWCMIRVAEMKDLSDKLKCAAVAVLKELDETSADAMESVIKKLSREELKRVICVAMDMMACVVDDPVWYEIDRKNCEAAGLTESFNRGKFLINMLTFDGDETVFFPFAVKMIERKYGSDSDWRVRHAAMFAMAAIAHKHFKGDMSQHLDKIVSLCDSVYISLNDNHPRVLWATIHAIQRLSEHKELLNNAQYPLKFLSKLIPITRTSLCAHLQVYAVLAIRLLVTNCGLEKILSFGEEIVVLLLVLLKHEKQKLQVEAVETLKSIAVLMPATFYQKYYDTAEKALKLILFDKGSSPKLFLRAKCLECMGILVRKVGQDVLKNWEVIKFMKTIVSVEGELNNTDHLTRCVILKALDQFCRCSRVNIDKIINQTTPMLLRCAQLDVNLTTSMPKDVSLDDDKHLVESVRVQACNILSCCAVRSAQIFSPYISMVTDMFLSLLGCTSFETRKASISALPNLLLSIDVGVEDINNKRDIANFIVLSMIEALHKETDSDLSKRMLRLLPKCIQISGSYFNSHVIEIIANVISGTLKKIIGNEIEREKEAETLEGGSGTLLTDETIKDTNFLIGTSVETFKIRFVTHIDVLMRNVAGFLGKDRPDRVIAFAISIFNILVPQFPDKLPPYLNKYIVTACDALRENYPHAQLHATRAIGICANFGQNDQLKTIVGVCVSRLYDVMTKIYKVSRESGDVEISIATTFDTAVAALGKICEFQRDIIDGPVYIG
ncbi:uncharacterized protein [Cicer arietinum]|uniref:uncharacterized protein isoform X3 n=1 Tax=Cicer arietinum TaxID=3827 RepID=UPI003CC58F3C